MEFRSVGLAVLVGLAVATLVGCAGPVGRRVPPPSSGPGRVRPQRPEERAVARLVQEAVSQGRKGEWPAAGAALERALDLDPSAPELWHRLAVVRLRQGQADQARALANRSNALAGGDAALQVENWRVIAEACRALGDEPCVRIAEDRARR